MASIKLVELEECLVVANQTHCDLAVFGHVGSYQMVGVLKDSMVQLSD